MANPRVHEIAAELGIESKIVLDKLKDIGQPVKGPSSSVAPPVARKVKEALIVDGVIAGGRPPRSPRPPRRPHRGPQPPLPLHRQQTTTTSMLRHRQPRR